MTVRIKDADHGMRALLDRMREASKGAGISVGVHAQEGAQEHKAKDGEVAPVTILDIALFNEFGLGVPERSFIRAWFDSASKENKEALERALKLVLKGGKTLPEALELVGLRFQGQIQKFIAAGVPPANAPATVAQKGSSKPLIDTGQLRDSVTFKVTDKPTD